MIEEIYIFITLLALSAFFSMSETALGALSNIKLRGLIDANHKAAKTLKRLKDDMHKTLTIILVGNNIANVAIASIVTSISIELFQNNAIAIATGITTLILLIFGEIVPKSLATKHSVRISLFVARPIRFFGWILNPIVFLLEIIRKLFVRGEDKEESLTEEELKDCVTIGAEAGNIKNIEKNLIHNIFKFDEITVSEIMTPRQDIVSFEVNQKLDDVADDILKSGYSRFPVYEESLDKIVGSFNVKDLIKAIKQKNKLNQTLKKFITKPFFVPENKRIDSLLRQFQKRKKHMALVVDEHGLIVGLITLENVLEEIVGEIKDETDKIEPHIVKNKKGWTVLGKSGIDEVNSKIKGIKIKESDEYDTISGYILNKLQRLPEENEEIMMGRYIMTVSNVEAQRILEVKIIRK